MNTLNINISINPEIYLRDPKGTNLGKRIIKNSIILIDKYGLDGFNFKKLAQKISSTESSIYRYFVSKNCLFIYLINWYWEWMSTRIDIATINVANPKIKVAKVIEVLTSASFVDMDIPFVDEELLHKIIIREGAKAYHHNTVDNQNEYGFFLSYKTLCKKISNIFLEINPEYKYPKSLASTLLESCNNNIYFAKHLPRLTDLQFSDDEELMRSDLFTMMQEMVFANLSFTPEKEKTFINHKILSNEK